MKRSAQPARGAHAPPAPRPGRPDAPPPPAPGRPDASRRRLLGDLLLAAGVVKRVQLDAALAEQRSCRERLGVLLVRSGVDPEQVARALADQLRLPYAAPPLAPEAAALRLVDAALATRRRVVPLHTGERSLTVAMADPLDAAAVDDLQFQTGRRVRVHVASGAAVEAALATAFHSGAVDAILDRITPPAPPRRGARAAREPAPAAEDTAALRRAAEAAPIVALVELLLRRAVERRASDVHVEPVGGGLRVRLRVDGVLQELVRLPAHAAAPVTSRLKVMGGLDIAIKRRPQDGRATVRAAGRELALRVSTLPAQGGEKVVLRILDPEQAGLPVERLGLAPAPLARLRALLGRSHGVLLVTGPTGSGKTTTLYACLSQLDRERLNVVTLEDPVEYRLPGLTQVQVHRRAGLGFGAALRAVLRQDPDVIMVGELRDRETVEIALTAALTGHLVLATLHTNDAATAAARLIEMRAPPYLVAGGLVGVVAQRLVRRLCPNCRVERSASRRELERLGLPFRGERLFDPRGCPRCGGSGFRGRTGIFEVLAVDARLRELILRKAPADALREAGRAAGTVPLSHDAWRQVRSGATSMEEVAALLALLADEAPVCGRCATALRHGWSWCPACGVRVRRACACGERLDEGWQRCPACGRPAAA